MDQYPVCIAKTQYSFSTDPNLKGAPNNHVVPIREVRLSAGAEFIVVICGEIMTMPGLPKVPSAEVIRLNDGRYAADPHRRYRRAGPIPPRPAGAAADTTSAPLGGAFVNTDVDF